MLYADRKDNRSGKGKQILEAVKVRSKLINVEQSKGKNQKT